jgi:hypothetical protein
VLAHRRAASVSADSLVDDGPDTAHTCRSRIIEVTVNIQSIRRAVLSTAIALIGTLAIQGTALAHPPGGGHGGGAHGGGGRGGGGYGGGDRGYGGHYGGRLGGYGGRYGGLRGGYGYYGGGGWGLLGYGLFFGALPLYYSTLWWNNVPYYYADANYYSWNAAAGEYETIRPPPEVESQVAPQEAAPADLFVYPKSNQNADLQARDRYECHRWATDQSGFDPTQPGGVPAAAGPEGGPATGPSAAATAPTTWENYMRAQTACLEARGYSVK